MKNVHLITKEQEGADVLHQYLYITSDEEIKQGDWFIYRCYKLCKCTGLSQSKQILTDNEIAKHKDYGKPQGLSTKIILTDNPDLIAEGVQPIDNEFLEWFVKNPSCEFVEVKNYKFSEYSLNYKIIIPQEEPKPIHEQIIEHCGGEEKFKEIAGLKPKQETLEEAAERILFENTKNEEIRYRGGRDSVIKSMLDIAKWQAERMYSEEDLLSAFEAGMMFIGEDKGSFKEWFEQFKKK
jgi:hypothetical protein